MSIVLKKRSRAEAEQKQSISTLSRHIAGVADLVAVLKSWVG